MSVDHPQMPLKLSLCPGLRLWELQGWAGKEVSGCNIPRLKSTCSELLPPPPKKGKGCEQYQKAFFSCCEGKEVVKRMKGIKKEMESTASLLLWIPNIFWNTNQSPSFDIYWARVDFSISSWCHSWPAGFPILSAVATDFCRHWPIHSGLRGHPSFLSGKWCLEKETQPITYQISMMSEFLPFCSSLISSKVAFWTTLAQSPGKGQNAWKESCFTLKSLLFPFHLQKVQTRIFLPLQGQL